MGRAAFPTRLTALRQDPDPSSSIIPTTVTDVTGFPRSLGIATRLSGARPRPPEPGSDALELVHRDDGLGARSRSLDVGDRPEVRVAGDPGG